MAGPICESGLGAKPPTCVQGTAILTASQNIGSALDPAASGMEDVGDGAMWLDGRYRAWLAQAGLSDFDAVMASRDGRCLRALKDRENWRFELPDAQAPRGVFLKKHHVWSGWSWLRAKLGLGPGWTPGLVEARNAVRLAQGAIPVMNVLAYGEKLHRTGLAESFVLTEELAGYTQLKDFLRRRFPPRGATGARRDPELKKLLIKVALLARRFHEAGYNHRDFYCCHFFVREPEPGHFVLKLIDLQRVQHRRWFRWRWVVKDLAQLCWSTPADRISCTQRLAFFRQYLGVRKLRLRDKWLIRAVLAKHEMMRRRLGEDP